jgi:hypothetical protein
VKKAHRIFEITVLGLLEEVGGDGPEADLVGIYRHGSLALFG